MKLQSLMTKPLNTFLGLDYLSYTEDCYPGCETLSDLLKELNVDPDILEHSWFWLNEKIESTPDDSLIVFGSIVNRPKAILSPLDKRYEDKLLSIVIPIVIAHKDSKDIMFRKINSLAYECHTIDAQDIIDLDCQYRAFFGYLYDEFKKSIYRGIRCCNVPDVNLRILSATFQVLSKLPPKTGCNISAIFTELSKRRENNEETAFLKKADYKYLNPQDYSIEDIENALVSSMTLLDTILQVQPEAFFELSHEVEMLTRVLYSKFIMTHLTQAVDNLRFIGMLDVTIANTIWPKQSLIEMCKDRGLNVEDFLADFPSKKEVE